MPGPGFEQNLNEGGTNNLVAMQDASHELSRSAFNTTQKSDASGQAAPGGSGLFSSRTATWLGDGAKSFLPGVGHSLVHDFTTADGLKSTAENLGVSALMGAALKAALPEGGIAGKVAGLAIGAYFGSKAAEPILNSYHEAQSAKTMDQLHAAGKQLGYTAGDLGVNLGIGGLGYGAGAWGANRILASESMDNFAVAKAKFWHPTEKFLANSTPNWLASRLITPEAIQTARTLDLNETHWDVKGNKATFLDSTRKAPEVSKPVTDEGGNHVAVNPNERFNISVRARSLDETGVKIRRRLQRIGEGKAGFANDEEIAAKFGAKPESMKAIKDWAQSKGLDVTLADQRTGRIVLNGTAAQMEDALGTKLFQYKTEDGVIHRGREGALTLDANVAPHIDSVLGADNRPQMRTMHTGFTPMEQIQAQVAGQGAGVVGPDVDAAAAGRGGLKPVMADDLARARGLTADMTGKGKTIGIGELGGDLDLADNKQFYEAHDRVQPDIIKKGVNGTQPQSDGPNGADGEVALDTVNAGLVAPGAKQVIAFGENSDAGFPDTQDELSFPTDNAPPADVVSWSWGQNQENWTTQAQRALTHSMQKSAVKGITTFVAAGDNGAADVAANAAGAGAGAAMAENQEAKGPGGHGNGSGQKGRGFGGNQFDVDFPSASPYVTSVGGTWVKLGNGKVIQEGVWNNGENGGSTGGGISNQTPRPDFQKGLKLPPNANGNGFDGRAVPDVSENADPRSGYVVRVDGQEGAIGGTSGAAPQWAAYTAAMGAKLGRNFGNMNYALYKFGPQGLAFNDITTGNNNGYDASKGYDPVTGWGSPKIGPLMDAFKNDASSQGKIRAMFPTIIQPGSDNQGKNNAG